MGLPRLPRLPLAEYDALHADFVRMFRKHHDSSLTRELCHVLAHNLHFAFDTDVLVDDIFQTLLQYVGHPLDDRWSDILARQLVARQKELRLGVLQLYERPSRDEWVPIEVRRLTPCVWREDRNGQFMELYCLGGHPAGHTLKKKVPEAWLSYLAYKVGFSRNMPYDQDPYMFVGLRFWAYLQAARRGANDLDFEEYQLGSQLRSHNRLIIARRSRFDFRPGSEPRDCSCPFDLDCYCSDCTHSVDECVASYLRERTYVRQPRLDGETASVGEP